MNHQYRDKTESSYIQHALRFCQRGMMMVESVGRNEWESTMRGTYIISFTAQLPERLDVEPGTFVPGWVQRNTHGILLQERREPFVHRQELVTLDVKKLRQKTSRLQPRQENAPSGLG